MFGCNFDSNSVIRIHIRANSNEVADQEIKLIVRDAVVDYITPLISDCDNSVEVKETLENNLNSIEDIADNILTSSGFDYKSKASINNEFFPSRDYDGVVFPSDYYDALILKLGTGTGDNWWCVAYPPLCFVGDDVSGGKVQYKSKLLELINKYLG